jgi:hypothetical protein
VSYDSSRFPDPYRSRSDASHASVFLVTLLLLGAVGYILFFGSSWIFAPVDAITGGATAPVRPLTADRTPVRPPPTFGAPTTVPPLAGVVIQPTPTATVPGAPTAAPGATPPPAAPANPSSPVAPPPPPPAPSTARVGNTGGDGVYLRHTPRLTDKWAAWADNTQLTLLGAEADGDGQHWVQVRDPRGNVGWVPAQFIVR